MSMIPHVKEVHFVTKQKEAEESFMEKFSQGNYTLENPLIIKNPYLLNPLSALVLFKTDVSVTATVSVKGKEDAGTIEKTFAANTVHVLPILGLYGDYDNVVEISLSSKASHTITITTDPLPENLDLVRNISTTPEYLGDNMMFITPTATSLPLAVDYLGDCRWFLTKNFTFNLMRAENGNLIIGSDRLMHPKYHMSGVSEMDMLGKIYTEYMIDGCYHHDQIELEDGNLIVLAQDFHSETIEDQAVLIDRKTGAELKRWDFKDVIPQDVGQAGHWYEKDWFHNNAVWYDKKTHSLSFSGRHQDAIINLDFETGALNWILGDPENWPQELVDKYFFTPVGDGDFDWQYEQHACLITPNGDVMCFDNGNYRSKDPEKRILNKDNFSRGVRYKINTDEMTIEQVWQFGKELGADFFSPYISNVEYYSEGHYMVHSGGIAFKDGVCSEKMGAILDPKDPSTDIRSRTVELIDDEIVYDMTITGQYYRAEKLSLYHDKANHTLGEGRVIGNLEITQEMDIEIPATDANCIIPEKFSAAIEEDEDRFIFKAKFEKGTLAMLLVETDEKTHRYYINTAKDALKAVCVATFIDRDDRWIQLNINKRGITGEGRIKLIVEDVMYDSGITITFN